MWKIIAIMIDGGKMEYQTESAFAAGFLLERFKTFEGCREIKVVTPSNVEVKYKD